MRQKTTTWIQKCIKDYVMSKVKQQFSCQTHTCIYSSIRPCNLLERSYYRLCFDCLGNHKSTTCQSKYCCYNCRGKHHATLCPGENISGRTPTSPMASTNSPQVKSQQPASSVHATLAPSQIPCLHLVSQPVVVTLHY